MLLEFVMIIYNFENRNFFQIIKICILMFSYKLQFMGEGFLSELGIMNCIYNFKKIE